MKKLPHPLLVLALLALNLFLASSAIAQDKGKLRRSERPIPNRYIVVLEESLVGSDNILPPAFREQRIRELADDLISLHGGRAENLFKTAVKGFSAEMSQAQAEALSRGVTHTTFRRITEALNLNGSLREDLRQLLISSRPEQYDAPLWRITAATE